MFPSGEKWSVSHHALCSVERRETCAASLWFNSDASHTDGYIWEEDGEETNWFHSEAEQETLQHNTVQQSEQPDCEVKPDGCTCFCRRHLLMLPHMLCSYINKLTWSSFIWQIPSDLHGLTDNKPSFRLIPELIPYFFFCSVMVTRVWDWFAVWTSPAQTAAGRETESLQQSVSIFQQRRCFVNRHASATVFRCHLKVGGMQKGTLWSPCVETPGVLEDKRNFLN